MLTSNNYELNFGAHLYKYALTAADCDGQRTVTLVSYFNFQGIAFMCM